MHSSHLPGGITNVHLSIYQIIHLHPTCSKHCCLVINKETRPVAGFFICSGFLDLKTAIGHRQSAVAFKTHHKTYVYTLVLNPVFNVLFLILICFHFSIISTFILQTCLYTCIYPSYLLLVNSYLCLVQLSVVMNVKHVCESWFFQVLQRGKFWLGGAVWCGGSGGVCLCVSFFCLSLISSFSTSFLLVTLLSYHLTYFGLHAQRISVQREVGGHCQDITRISTWQHRVWPSGNCLGFYFFS